MPAIETRDRNQAAVLWAFAGYDGYGQAIQDGPVGLRVRWKEARTEAVDAQDNVIALDATAVVDREVAVGSVMLLGTLEDWLGTGSAGDDSRLFEVKTFSGTPDLKNRNVRRTVGLMRLKSTLPGAGLLRDDSGDLVLADDGSLIEV